MSTLALAKRSLAEALPDFATARVPPPRPAAPAREPAAPAALMPSWPSEEEIDARVEAAVAQAIAECETRLRAEHEDAVAALAEAHAAELARREAEHGEVLGAALKAGLDEIERKVTDLTTSVAARLLGVALTDEVCERAVAQLAARISDAIGDSDAVSVTVRGPLSLHEALMKALGERSMQVSFIEAGGADLVATVDDTHFETRIAAWSDSLSGAVL
ncbi:MAG: hypothetical protein K5872_12365 [Rhizobiaceae bacterium]|nr:hypothetical protein [Rhizobiaceae bacterium]MCV0407011.1 hypothetical protein [Rhizobiaceae bacterium]